MATRTTVYLDESLLEQVRRFVPSRGLSSQWTSNGSPA